MLCSCIGSDADELLSIFVRVRVGNAQSVVVDVPVIEERDECSLIAFSDGRQADVVPDFDSELVGLVAHRSQVQIQKHPNDHRSLGCHSVALPRSSTQSRNATDAIALD